MVAATVTLVTLVFAALVGFVVYRWRREKPSSIAWAIGSSLLAVLIFLVTGVIYLYYALLYPSSNSGLFNPDELVLAFGHDAAPHAQGLEDGTHDHLVFRQPTTAGVGSDFHVHLRVPSVTATGPIQVELSAPESFGMRTEYRCPTSGTLATVGVACGTVTNHVFEVDWTITPKSTSTSELWVILPPELRPDAIYGSDWLAFPYVGGLALTWWSQWSNRASGDEATPNAWPSVPFDYPEKYLENRREQDSRGEAAARSAVRLDAGSPRLFYRAYNVDLSLGRLGAQTTVVRTLGVSDNTYAFLALFGAVAASALGSGWLVQFVAWVRKKLSGQTTAPPSPQAL
jgi:hypothetical protein